MVTVRRQAFLRLKRLPIIFMAITFPIMNGSDVSAGNKEMVEDAVKELDEINKEAIQQIPELPPSGKVELETNVLFQNGLPIFDFTSTHVTSEKSQEIHFTEGNQIHSEGIEGR